MNTQWFLYRDGNEHGPYSWEQLTAYAREGRLVQHDQVKSNQMDRWASAGSIQGLFSPAPNYNGGPPPMPNASAPSQHNIGSGVVYVGVGQRFAALLLDGVVFFILGFVIAMATGNTTGTGYALEGAPAFFLFFLGILYNVLMEGFLGGTVGKMVLGISVRKLDGSLPGLVPALIRNLLRIVDGLPLFYLVGIILVNKSPKKQRFGDRVAETVVVKKSSL